MIENKSGKIINVASIAAKTPLSGLGVYNISKAAVVMLTKVLAKELASENIQVNTLAPGLIKTDFSRALWEDENVYSQIIKSIPQARMGEPDDISGMALYLASDASDFITGSLFTVDGGKDAKEGEYVYEEIESVDLDSRIGAQIAISTILPLKQTSQIGRAHV